MLPSSGGYVGTPDPTLIRDVLSTALRVAETAWSGVLAAGHVDETSQETAIAAELYTEMQSLLDDMPDPVPFLLGEESGTRHRGSRRPTGRVDIRLIYGLRSRQFLLMECKRIRAHPARLARYYVHHGVLRFVSGQYWMEHCWGALLGFVIDRDSSGCSNAVQREIESHPDVGLTLAWTPDPSWHISAPVFRTGHSRQPDGDSILLLHVFFSW
jgi:hypothetical protein